MEGLKLVKIVLKSGVQINTEKAASVEVVLREETYIDVEYDVIGGDEVGVKKERKRYETFLRIERENTFFEIREDEVAAFEYEKNSELVM